MQRAVGAASQGFANHLLNTRWSGRADHDFPAQLLAQPQRFLPPARVVRGSLLKGHGVMELWPSLGILGVFVLVVSGLAIVRYRTTLD